MVLRRRGSNAISQPGRNELIPVEHELAALDDLGPKTRYAIVNAPLSVLAVSIVSQIIDVNDKIEADNHKRAEQGLPLRSYLDPRHPDLDERLANGVVRTQFELLNTERQIEDAAAGCRPLVGRMSPRTAREQNRAMRGARRWR